MTPPMITPPIAPIIRIGAYAFVISAAGKPNKIPNRRPTPQPGHPGKTTQPITSPIAKRSMNAASSAARLSGKDIGNIIATETAPKISPPITPDIKFDITCRLNAVVSAASNQFSHLSGQVPALFFDMGFLLKRFETLVPLAAKWASEQEQRILREGVPLSDQEIVDARAVGVQAPDHVRLLRVKAIPSPGHPMLKIAQSAINLLTSTPRGLTLQHGIFVRSDCWRNRAL